MTKHLLFSLEEPTAVGDIQKEIPDATEKEVTTVNLLIQTLKPYIPDKKNRFVIDYQLPFCLLANDILHITGYTKFTRSLFPTPRPTKLQALEINVPSLLYQMLTSEPNAFSIADFVGGAAEKEPTSYISRILNNPVVKESKKDLSDLKQAVDTLQNKINNLKEELWTLYKSDLVMNLTELKDGNKDDSITRLKATKKKRQEAYQAIQVCRSSKAALNPLLSSSTKLSYLEVGQRKLGILSYEYKEMIDAKGKS
ncbi:hypothetical protein HPULCUR_004173 [Helicostylum pulchrum]|uniref:Uncharacterized protein n=1 Tax=Helicostylum pulchrum TaxID=562976 RepID=A0ABP9XVG4_9FUNG